MLHVSLPEPVPKGITGILALLTVSERRDYDVDAFMSLAA